eukprot:9836667-Karenia_brevis.AAC.1
MAISESASSASENALRTFGGHCESRFQQVEGRCKILESDNEELKAKTITLEKRLLALESNADKVVKAQSKQAETSNAMRAEFN